MRPSDARLLCDVEVSRFDAYTGARLLNLSIRAEEGDCIWISGPTGSGKSTILRLLALQAERTGTPVISIGPHAIITTPLRVMEMKSLPDLAYLSQETAENLVAPTAAEDIETSLMNEGSNDSSHAQNVIAVLEGETQELKSNWRTLSSGWRQLVSVLSTSALRRRVYLFDEPLANLDSVNAAKVISAMRVVRERGACVVFASHDVRMMADEVSGACTGWNLERHDRSVEIVDLLVEAGQAMMTLNPLSLEARDLTVSLGRHNRQRVLAGCNLTVAPGELVAVVGRNGSGKTTLARALAGLLRPVSGKVLVEGRPMTETGVSVGYSPQSSRHALLGRTLGEELRLSLSCKSQRRVLTRLKRFLDLGLGALSFGERKLLALVITLLSRPLCVIDEPLAGLDSQMIGQVQGLLAIARECGRGVVSFVPQGQVGVVGATRVLYLRGGALISAL